MEIRTCSNARPAAASASPGQAAVQPAADAVYADIDIIANGSSMRFAFSFPSLHPQLFSFFYCTAKICVPAENFTTLRLNLKLIKYG